IEIDLQLQSLASFRREEALTELREVQTVITELSLRRQALLVELARLDIRAPRAGVIHDLRVLGAGSVIRPTEELLSIIPQNAALIVTAAIDRRDIDQVYPGQPVTLRLATRDWRDGADLHAQVRRVSPDIYADDISGIAHYRAEIATTGDWPVDLALIPGMPVEVFIRTRARRPVDYLLDPLARHFARSLRDG
ncbi:MAG: HlyD family efflux transporter periplasmic adaptor subunit, partial [Loktanella sp.]|nr:HlyD family efflux transporter periplasmic adaptor subunit [Loktanella sp.]